MSHEYAATQSDRFGYNTRDLCSSWLSFGGPRAVESDFGYSAAWNAAAAAGIKEGDVIVSLDGKKITKMSELQEATTKYSPGDKAVVGYMRDKKLKTTTITFRNAKGNTNVVKTEKIDVLGAEFKELTDSQKKDLNMTYGVQITKLGNGKLKDAGIPENFIILKVNNQNIKTVNDLESVFKSAQSSTEQTLWIWGKTPAGNARSFAVYLGDE